MNVRMNEMTDAELAAWQYAHRDELESDEGEEVEVEISPQLSVTISFRLPGTEADAIRNAAHDAGVSLSEWIRQACANSIEPDEAANERRAARSELRDAARQLEALARRFDAATRRQSSAAKGIRRKKAVSKKPRQATSNSALRRT